MKISAGHLVTALKEIINSEADGNWTIIKVEVTGNARFEPLCFGYISIFY